MRQWKRDRYSRRDAAVRLRRPKTKGKEVRIFPSLVLLPPVWRRGGLTETIQVFTDERLTPEELLPIEDIDEDPLADTWRLPEPEPMSFFEMFGPNEDIEPPDHDDMGYDPYWWD